MNKDLRIIFVVSNALVISSGINLILSAFVALFATNDTDQMKAVIVFGCFTVFLYGIIAPYIDFMATWRSGEMSP